MFQNLTVIIPAYNAAKYIKECIECFLDYPEMKVLIVDDGSTDDTVERAKQYEKCMRLKVLEGNHGGVSNASNIGLVNTETEYVMFMDADDLINLSKLPDEVFEMMEKKIDLIDLSALHGRENIVAQLSEEQKKDIILGLSGFKGQKNSVKLGDSGPIAKLYNMKIINKKNIRFNTDIYKGEDALFVMRFVTYASSLARVPVSIYRYRQHENSVTKKFPYSILNNHQNYVTEVLNIAELNTLPVVYRRELQLRSTINDALDCIRQQRNEDYYKISQSLNTYTIKQLRSLPKRLLLVAVVMKFNQLWLYRSIRNIRVNLKKIRKSQPVDFIDI